jgi:uncharacterized protein (TIGR03083 family)
MDHPAHRAAIESAGGRLAAIAPEALDRPVPSCPGWSVERLVGHVGRTHVWATSFLALGTGDGRADPGDRPPTGAAVLHWYRERLDLLLGEVDRHEPDEPTGSFVGPVTAAFWARRQAHELAVHLWDAQEAIEPGGGEPIAAAVAADGVDEWLEVFVPRFLARREAPIPTDLVGATVHLHCTDPELAAGSGEWLLRITDAGCDVERTHAKGDAAVRGSASDLLLAVWHRKPLDGLDVFGDADRAAGVLDLVHVT